MKNFLLALLLSANVCAASVGDLLLYRWDGTMWIPQQIAGIANNTVLQIDNGGIYKFGQVTNAQIANGAVALLSGTNTGDQTTIVGITGTLAEFNAALTGADFATGGGTATGTNTGDQLNILGNAATVTTNANLTGPVTSVGNATAIGNAVVTNAMLVNGAVALLSGTNTGDQTNILGNSATVTTNANLTGPITSVGNATTITANSVNGTHIALGSDAQGDIMYYNGTDWVRLGPGTSGQYLKTLGAAANPAWDSPSGSGDVLGPATNSDSFVPMWNGANTKTLKNGVAASGGGFSGTDSGKVVLFGAPGNITAISFRAKSGASNIGQYDYGSLTHYDNGSGFTQTTSVGALTANRNLTEPDKTGVIAIEEDNRTKAYFVFNGTVAGATNTAFTYSRTLTTVTVTMTGHGHLVGHMTYLDFITGGALDGNYAVVSVVDANTFTVTTAASGAIAAGSTGQEQRRNIIYTKGSNPIHSVCPNAAQVGSFYLNWTTAYATIDYSLNATASIAGNALPAHDSVEAHQTARGNISVFTFAGAPSATSTAVHVEVVY